MTWNWTETEFKNYQNKMKPSAIFHKKSKYKNIITKIDGNSFSSKKEANYYLLLKDKLKNKEIAGFSLQPIFLLAGGIKYKADFIIFENNKTSRIIEIKGYKTKEFIIKQRLFIEMYPNLNLEVIEE